MNVTCFIFDPERVSCFAFALQCSKQLCSSPWNAGGSRGVVKIFIELPNLIYLLPHKRMRLSVHSFSDEPTNSAATFSHFLPLLPPFQRSPTNAPRSDRYFRLQGTFGSRFVGVRFIACSRCIFITLCFPIRNFHRRIFEWILWPFLDGGRPIALCSSVSWKSRGSHILTLISYAFFCPLSCSSFANCIPSSKYDLNEKVPPTGYLFSAVGSDRRDCSKLFKNVLKCAGEILTL